MDLQGWGNGSVVTAPATQAQRLRVHTPKNPCNYQAGVVAFCHPNIQEAGIVDSKVKLATRLAGLGKLQAHQETTSI